MPITRIRAAKPVELEAPTTGEGDTVAIHAKSGDTHEALSTNGSGALNVAVVSGGGGGGGGNSNVSKWSTAFIQNQGIAENVSGATKAVVDFPWFPDLTAFKIAATTGIGPIIRLYGQFANGEITTTEGTFSGGEFVSPANWAACVFRWEWLSGENNAPAPTAGQSCTLYYWSGATWISYMAATTDYVGWQANFMLCPPGRKLRIKRISRFMGATGYTLAVRVYPFLTFSPRSNQFSNQIAIQSFGGQYTTHVEAGLDIEARAGQALAIEVQANSIETNVSAE